MIVLVLKEIFTMSLRNHPHNYLISKLIIDFSLCFASIRVED